MEYVENKTNQESHHFEYLEFPIFGGPFMDFLQTMMFPFSFLMTFLYGYIGNYGITLILFAFLVKILLFPFSLKGKRGMIQMNMMQGKVKQIQTRYANDREKMNQEIQALYLKEQVNPMGGCLWTMLPMFVLIPLYAVVRRPLRYLMGLNDEVIEEITVLANKFGISMTEMYPEISIVSGFFKDKIFFARAQNMVGDVELFGMDFSFLGIDLAAVPTLKFWEQGMSWAVIGLFLVPIISAVSSFISSRIMMKTNEVNRQGQQSAEDNPALNANSKMMLWMGPCMALYIGYIMPAGMGVYWIANSVFGVGQELIAGRMLRKDYAAAAAAREAQERAEKEEEKKKHREAMERKAQGLAESKGKKGKKGQVDGKAKENKEPKDTAVISVSGVGTRAYARGRAYDPNRFSPEGPTPYRESNSSKESGETQTKKVSSAKDKDPWEDVDNE